jgi:hypothetical protein
MHKSQQRNTNNMKKVAYIFHKMDMNNSNTGNLNELKMIRIIMEIIQDMYKHLNEFLKRYK